MNRRYDMCAALELFFVHMIPEVLYDERGTFTKYKRKRHSRLRRLELLLFYTRSCHGLAMGLPINF